MKNIIGLLAFIILPLLAVAQGTIPFTPAVIFNGNTVRTLRSQIDINQQAFIRTGSDDPTVVATDGPQGSIYLRTGVSGGQFYTKQDAGVTTNWTQMAGGGSVASVALSLPSIFTVTGSPVTSTGTLTGTLIDQIANSIWSGPASGPNAPPTFRALVSADIPGLSAAKITSGQGTLSTTTSGVTVGSGSNALLTSATIDVQPATGSQPGLLTAADWTTFNGKASGSRAINTTAPLTGGGDLSADRTLAIPAADGSTNGYLTSTDWLTFSGKQDAGSYITDLTGDVTASGPGAVSATVVKIQGTAVSATPPTSGQVLTYNSTSTQWEPGPGGTPSGTANRVAVFDGSGNLTTDTELKYFTATNSMSMGVSTDASNGGAAGALAFGHAIGSSSIVSSSVGSLAFGSSDNTSTITASNQGAEAHGRAVDGSIAASGEGSRASGLVVGGGSIAATGNGAYASGFSVDGATGVLADGGISFTHGFGTKVHGDFAAVFGVGSEASAYGSFTLGRYGDNTGTTTSWVSTDPLFVVGYGASSGSPDNAFWIRKDGTLYIKGPSLSGSSVGYVWTLQDTATGEGAWAAVGGGGGVTTMGAFGSSPNSNGGSISGVTLTLQPADGSNPGGVTTGTQTFAGAKTFSTSATSPIFSTSSAQPASTGNFRLSNGEAIGWRNSTNSSDKFLSVDAGDNLLLSGAMKLTLTGSTTGQFRQGAAASTTTYAVVWPSAQGSADTFPRNDGSGNLTWVAPSVLAAQVKTTGTAPSVSSCGSSPSVAGNDSVGRITIGSGGVATSCTLTFNATWGTAPACTLGDETTALLLKGSASTTALTITVATPFGAGDTVVYNCLGY